MKARRKPEAKRFTQSHVIRMMVKDREILSRVWRSSMAREVTRRVVAENSLVKLLRLYDRLENGGGSWSPDDTVRLADIRALVGEISKELESKK